MKTKFPFVLVVLFSLLIVSCSKESASDVNQAKIYTVYELSYNANTDKTTAVARFRFGGATGTLLELDGEDEVSFNDEDLTYNAWWGAHTKEFAGLVTNGTFSYTNLDGQTYVNTIPGFEAIAFPAEFDTIQKGQANTLAWDGTALSANQSVSVYVGTWTWNQNALFYQDQDNATSVIMGMNLVEGIANGNATVIMDRATEVPVTQGTTEGGRVRGVYRALNQQVQVVE